MSEQLKMTTRELLDRIEELEKRLQAAHIHNFVEEDGYRCACGIVAPDRDDRPETDLNRRWG